MALEACVNIDIPVIDSSLSNHEFKNKYFNPGLPVIIDGYFENWPARHWTLESLKEKAGDEIVHCRWQTDRIQYKLGQQYSIRQTTFGEYIDDIIISNKRAFSSYLAVQNIKKALPQLQDDIAIPEYVGKVHGGPFLWISNQGHYEYTHFDPDDGFLILISGEKVVRLFQCGDLKPFYPNKLGTKGRTIQSQVFMDDVDLNNYPLFQGLQCHFATLKPGQMLYIPSFWWHQVTSTQISISLNIFWGNDGTNDYVAKILRQPVLPHFTYWLLNIVEQNRDHKSFSRTLARLSECVRNFLVTQWHDSASDEQLGTIVQLIYDYLRVEGSSCALVPSSDDERYPKNPPALKIRGLLWRN